MKHHWLFITVLLFSCRLFAADAAEQRLREGLKNTMLQLRSVQAERDNLQAQNAELDQKLKSLDEQAKKLTKQLAADRDAAEKMIGELKAKSEQQSAELEKLKETLLKTQAALKQASDVAKAKEMERARLANETIDLQHRNEDQQRKNLEMYKLAMEILSRYERFGLGTALTAREPFIGITKVKLQNLIQDYSDKLSEQKIKPQEKKAPETEAHK